MSPCSECSECGGLGYGRDRIDGDGDVYQDVCARCAGSGNEPEPRAIPAWTCTATKRDGTPCGRYAGSPPPRLCRQHERMAKVAQ